MGNTRTFLIGIAVGILITMVLLAVEAKLKREKSEPPMYAMTCQHAMSKGDEIALNCRIDDLNKKGQ